MTTIAIVGAGRGLGIAAARKFGAEGFDIALISRSQEHVDALAGDLTSEGLSTRGYAASVRDTTTLTSALNQASQELGPIEVLQYSPIPQKSSYARCWTPQSPTWPRPSSSPCTARSPL
jgi:NAD(P)-dependent dehydrogenase (short-subunit alcohol dehydrogenase family)